jgi:RNA polymerase sigma-70 factor (ECF subfamily)
MTALDDARTLERLRAGDRAEFERVFRAHYTSLCAFVSRVAGSPHVAEELVQETFLRLWINRERLELHTSLRAYLFAAARNRALNHVKRAALEQRSSDPESAGADAADAEPAALRTVETAELRDRVRAAVARLSPRLRETVELRWGRQWSHAEIAEAMGISIKAVEANLTRARAALRPLLEGLID